MSELDPTSSSLHAALSLLRKQAQPGTHGKQSSRSKVAEQLGLEVDDILRRWSSELASPEMPAPKQAAERKAAKEKADKE